MMASRSLRRAAEVAATNTRVTPPPFFFIMRRSPDWPVRERDGHLHRGAASKDAGLHGISHLRRAEQVLNVSRVLHGISLHLEHQVSQQNAGLIGGTRWLDMYHQKRAVYGRRDLGAERVGYRHGLHGEAKVRFGDVPLLDEFIDHTI